ncbi:MAG: SpaA isopeptide-forming pilin-related protein, partial [Ruminococcus sp.]
TFYFTAFTKNEKNEFVKSPYTEVQSLTLSGGLAGEAVTGKVSFDNLPVTEAGVTYYILETDAKGNRIEKNLTETDGKLTYTYEAVGGTVCEVSSTAGIKLSTAIKTGTCEIGNTEKQVYQIHVTKKYDGTDTDATFKVAVFTLPENADASVLTNFAIVDGTVTEIKGGQTVDIDLPDEGEYYVFEVDDSNKPIAHNTKIASYTVQYPDGVEIRDTAAGGAKNASYKIVYVPTALTKSNNEANVTVGNYTKLGAMQPTIELTKYLSVDGFADGTPSGVTNTMTFGLFTGEVVDDAMVYTEVEGYRQTITISGVQGNGNYSGNVTFNLPEIPANDLEPKTYYIFELDGDTPVEKGAAIPMTIGSDSYNAVVNYDSAGGIVISQTELEGTAAVQNTITADAEISFSKWDEKGDALAGATMQLTGALDGVTVNDSYELGKSAAALTEGQYFISGNTLTWVTNGTELVLKGVKDGSYTLSETNAPENYGKIQDITFTVENGIIKEVVENGVIQKAPFEAADGSYSIHANSISVSDKLIENVVISKQDMNRNEIAGASMKFGKMTVTEEDGELVVTMKDGEVDTELIDSWISTTTPHEITTKLADGYYLLHEELAPDGYTVATDIYVSIKNNKVDAQYKLTDGKLVKMEPASGLKRDENKIIMTDELSEIVISKKELGANNAAVDLPANATNAEFVLSGSVSLKDVIFDNVVTSEEDAEEITYGKKTAGDVTTFSYEGNEVKITGLKDGTYTLQETTAPDGYTVVSTFKFTIENGIVADKTIAVSNGEVTVSEDGKTVTVA